MGKHVWANSIEQAAWEERWCRICFQPDEATLRVTKRGYGCALKALGSRNVLPDQWHKRRAAVLGDTYKCDAYTPKPDSTRRKSAPADTEPMFDAPESDCGLVPVEGWPDYKAQARLGPEKL